MAAPVGTIGALGAATLALHFRDPHARASWGLCPSAAMGFWCPGCGGLRAVNDLTNLQFADAASSNLLFVALLPFLLLGLGVWTVRRWRGQVTEPNARLITVATVSFCAVAVVFAIVRNMAVGSWLAP